jgi:hypothetical protein
MEAFRGHETVVQPENLLQGCPQSSANFESKLKTGVVFPALEVSHCLVVNPHQIGKFTA